MPFVIVIFFKILYNFVWTKESQIEVKFVLQIFIIDLPFADYRDVLVVIMYLLWIAGMFTTELNWMLVFIG